MKCHRSLAVCEYNGVHIHVHVHTFYHRQTYIHVHASKLTHCELNITGEWVSSVEPNGCDRGKLQAAAERVFYQWAHWHQ